MAESVVLAPQTHLRPMREYPQILLPALAALAVAMYALSVALRFQTRSRPSLMKKGTKRHFKPPKYMSTLAKTNPHPRDSRIQFQDEGHVYFIDGGRGYTSVTTWGGSHFPKFDPDLVIERMMNGKNWHKSQYNGMSPEAIKNQWDTNGNVSRTLGTKLHDDIERTIDGQKVVNTSPEYKYFLNYRDQKLTDNKPYRTEWTIFDEEHKLAGSIDYAAIRPDGTIDLYDWKRSKEIKMDGYGEYALTPCIRHIPNANYWKYALQLNIYRDILERCYGLKINSMTIVCLYPDNPSYLEFDVPRMEDEMRQLLEDRKQKMVRKAKTAPAGMASPTGASPTGASPAGGATSY